MGVEACRHRRYEARGKCRTRQENLTMPRGGADRGQGRKSLWCTWECRWIVQEVRKIRKDYEQTYLEKQLLAVHPAMAFIKVKQAELQELPIEERGGLEKNEDSALGDVRAMLGEICNAYNIRSDDE